jgi:hypothetical protein
MQLRPSPPRPWWRGLLLLPLLACVSCGGPKHVQVKGTLKIDGEGPPQGAVLTFHPAGADPNDMNLVRSIGVVSEDGTFTLETGKKKGAPAGEYIVTITWPEKPKGMTMGPPEARDKLKNRYAIVANSKIKVQIKEGETDLEPITLKKE